MAKYLNADALVEHSNSESALMVVDVIENADITYAVLQNEEGQYAAAYELWEDANDGWYFVNDCETTWKNERFIALGEIVIAMKELHDLGNA